MSLLDRDPIVKAAEDTLKAAEDVFNTTVCEFQKTCPHEVLIEREAGNPYQYIDTYYEAQRVCPRCGLWEKGDWGHFKVLNSEVVIKKPVYEDIYSYRITCKEVTNCDD